MKIPVTKHRIQVHLHYFWWVYVLMTCLIVFATNILYNTTRYRSPAELKIEWYYQEFAPDFTLESADALMKDINEQLGLGMEELNFMMAGTDETYGDMQLTVWISAGEGDIYQLTTKTYTQYAVGGAFLNLQPYIDSGKLDVKGLRLCYTYDEDTHEKYPAGIYTSGMTGLNDLGIVSEDMVIGVMVNCGNTDNSLAMLNEIINRMVPAEGNVQ